MLGRFPGVGVLSLESGGDNLAASFNPELVHVTAYVIDVAGATRCHARAGWGDPQRPVRHQQDRPGSLRGR